MMMPTVNAVANKGAVLNLTNVPFTITDTAAYTDFTAYALTSAKFNWTISTTGLVVNAMGSSLPGVTMTKTVSLDGFNSLAGLKLTAYNITDIDAAGMHLQIMAELYNLSTIGMTIPQSIFNTESHGKVLGPAVATNLALEPHSPSPFILDATIATGNGDLTPYLTVIFQNALSGVDTPLDAQGVGAPGVSWLDNAIKQLRLSTSLPPLPYDPIESVVIDAMSMDFTCASCIWAPTAGSSITAKTNLPFAKGAPIVKLKQNIDVLDSAGNRVGRLDTEFEDAISNGAYVSTSTTPGPLTIYDDAHQTYIDFIDALNVATKYSLGLNGTADSILNLGDLGNITVTGIKLNVKTELDGLRSLADIKFINTLNLVTAGDDSGATVLVAINNPSKLTLTIGDLVLNSGVNYTDEGYAGKSYLTDLVLSPGRNEVIAFAKINSSIPVGEDIFWNKLADGFNLYLQPFKGSSKNPALDAGLQKLRQVLVMPPMMVGEISAKPYAIDWTLKVPDSAVNDGIVYATTIVGNPYFSQELSFLSVNSLDINEYALDPKLIIKSKLGAALDFFNFVPPGAYSLKGNETRELTFAIQMAPTAPLQFWINLLPELIETANTVGVLPLEITLMPKVQVGKDPRLTSQDFSSTSVYGTPSRPGDPLPPPPVLNLHVGPDFSNVLKYVNRLATPTTLPSVATSTAVMPPVVPSPTTTSTVAPVPPVVTPSPGTTDPVVPPPSSVPTSGPSPVPSP
ncbi:MAG: hypothetical protein BYD32DRAFT_144221 [Podila humilis]|nr:MAG: hypothetical protein BYD32DRAFT_144221 [Podila humilis]